MAPLAIDRVETFFSGGLEEGQLALVAQALGKGGFERSDAFAQALVLLARLLRHGLDRLEILPLHHVEAVEHALGLGADDAFDLLADAVGGPGLSRRRFT